MRHAYVKLAGAVYASLGRNSGIVDVESPSSGAFRADLEDSSKSTIAALLRVEFQAREDAVVAMAHETPRGIGSRTPPRVPLPFSPTHQKTKGVSRRYAVRLLLYTLFVICLSNFRTQAVFPRKGTFPILLNIFCLRNLRNLMVIVLLSCNKRRNLYLTHI